MAQTPATSRLTTGRETGSQPGQGINNVNQVAPGGYNGFEKPWNNFITPRFAEITPFFYTDTVGKSKELLINTHQVRAYTMSAPNMQEIRMHKSYYSVPKEAIMPNTWEYWFKNPKHGDDVPPDSCYPGSRRNILYSYIPQFNTLLTAFANNKFPDKIYASIRLIGVTALLFSCDSLLALLGSPLSSPRFLVSRSDSKPVEYNIDTFIDFFITAASKSSLKHGVISDSYGYTKEISETSSLSDVRDFFLTLFLDSDFSVTTASSSHFIDYLVDVFSGFKISVYHPYNSAVQDDTFVSFDMAKAYQMTIAQFFTNSDVDDIYTYKMWEDNSLSITQSITSRLPGMTYNGTYVIYDSYSEAAVKEVFATLISSNSISASKLHHYLSNLLCIRKSLIYRDYFYGARLSPLAVGDVNASVNSEKVSAIDITKSIVMQRFLNAVNKVPGDILSYLKGIFGYEPIRIPPQPIFLAEDIFTVQGELVANTSNVNQGNLVQNISFRDADRGYEVYNDCESFLFGFVWFDYVPAYTIATDRLRLMNDRFDFFQPFLQTIGDQPVLAAEANNEQNSDTTISWQIRNMEYKQRFSKKVGGFVNDLPNWTLETKQIPHVLSPNSIRNENKDIDPLYSSLTGASPANYFHYIMSNHNAQISNLPMLRQPGIL